MENVLLILIGSMGVVGAVLFIGTFFYTHKGGMKRADVPIPE